ncbi:hypothetical protein Ami103574_06160 [Aminipila butyrica]|uniref:Bacterial transcriptional activator domain-containing protein n=1 Tax=Aminipila butyrica TaxID=433296 RepID=A0A858BSI3_9FIRM|nr:BTAD domain-containing putative transcriptional regulator [Aminipila butyrica]QIB68931.1 hypothetical protein Ami103574_06160 [Aminipila butyrica]
MTELMVNMMGRVEFKYGEKNLEHKLSNKGIALISLLMLHMEKGVSRERLISFLWADSDEEAAKYNLRYNLWNIKKVIHADKSGHEFIVANKDYCQLNHDYDFESDLLKLMTFESRGADPSIEELYSCKQLFRGDFLEGIYLRNCDEFNEKIILERIVYQNKYVALLNAIAEKYEVYENFEECVTILNELVCIEPYNEKVVQRQMKAYIGLGKRSEAINCYKKFEAALRSDLNISPTQELKLLYNELLEKPQVIMKAFSRNGSLKRQKMEIEVQCIENIDYFCMADIVRKIILQGDRKYIFGLNKCYLDDLNFIQLEVGLGYEKLHSDKCCLYTSLPSVRIVDAFIKFILYINEIYVLHIRISGTEKMDQISRYIINYLKQLQAAELYIKES